MTNTNSLQNVACPKCKHEDSFEVEVRARAVIIDNGAESYEDPMWEDDAGTTCKNCGFQGNWAQFVTPRPYSSCIVCERTIYWNHTNWVDDDALMSCQDDPFKVHRPKWLTLGELRDKTKHLPDTMPVTVGQEPGDWYNNLRLDDVPEDFDPVGGDVSSLILTQADDMDPQQW